MKVQVLSDLHIEFENYTVDTTGADVVVLAGDIHIEDKGVLWALENIRDKPVIYVLGNHEYYGSAYPQLAHSLKKLTQGTNVKVLENDTFTFEGVNFLGCTLWTDFELFGDAKSASDECQQRMSDYRKIDLSPGNSKLSSVDVAGIHSTSLNWLKKELELRSEQMNIVVTHHGPDTHSLPDKNSDNVIYAAYVSRLERILIDYKPDMWLHGHLHNSSDYTLGNCRVICNPRGYPGGRNPDFNDHLLLELINEFA